MEISRRQMEPDLRLLASFSDTFLVTGKIQGKLDGSFSGMLWRGIVLGRKLIYRTFKPLPTIFR